MVKKINLLPLVEVDEANHRYRITHNGTKVCATYAAVRRECPNESHLQQFLLSIFHALVSIDKFTRWNANNYINKNFAKMTEDEASVMCHYFDGYLKMMEELNGKTTDQILDENKLH